MSTKLSVPAVTISAMTLLCSVPGCDHRAASRGWCRAHYERWRRFGDPDAERPLAKQGHPRRKSHGYVVVYRPGHPLTQVSGMGNRVYEHRAVYYDVVGGSDQPCHRCGLVLTWSVDLHVDHLDGDQTNNKSSNLAAVCARCNVKRRPRTGRQTKVGAEARTWAVENGFAVGRRGPLSQAALDAFAEHIRSENQDEPLYGDAS